MGQINIFATTISTHSGHLRVRHFSLSMLSLDVTQHPHSLARAWLAWDSYSEVTKAFIHIAQHPYEPICVSSNHFLILERFTVVVVYHKSSSLSSVNEAHRELFCKKNKMFLLLNYSNMSRGPFSKATFGLPVQTYPSPGEYKEDKSWKPVWIIPEAAKACSELIKCGCKSQRGCFSLCMHKDFPALIV